MFPPFQSADILYRSIIFSHLCSVFYKYHKIYTTVCLYNDDGKLFL